jgi:hypothetical protein
MTTKRLREHPEGAVVRVEDMGPVERAYAEAMHEDCPEEPKGHPLSDHSPWSGGDLDGTEPWDAFVDRLARHGLTLTLAAAPVDRDGPTDERGRITGQVEGAAASREAPRKVR